MADTLVIRPESKIVSGKHFIVKISGMVPPNMTVEQLGVAVQHGISMTVAFRKIATDMSVEIGEIPPASVQ